MGLSRSFIKMLILCYGVGSVPGWDVLPTSGNEGSALFFRVEVNGLVRFIRYLGQAICDSREENYYYYYYYTH
jgi:hypothetical protein